MLDEESRELLDDIFKNDSRITEDTTLQEARYLLMATIPPPIRSKKKNKKKSVKKNKVRKQTKKRKPKKSKLTQKRKEKKREKRKEIREKIRETLKQKELSYNRDSDSGIEELIAQGDVMGEISK